MGGKACSAVNKLNVPRGDVRLWLTENACTLAALRLLAAVRSQKIYTRAKCAIVHITAKYALKIRTVLVCYTMSAYCSL